MLIGYARVSTDKQDVTTQLDALTGLGIARDRIYIDEGRTGRNTDRPGLTQALAACRSGDELVVTKLDRLARSLPDARAIADALADRGVRLNLGGEIYDPTSPTGRMFFNMLALMAEFESDLIRARTKEGMALAKKRGRLQGRKPKLTSKQEAHAVTMLRSGEHTVLEVAELFKVSRATMYRALDRAADADNQKTGADSGS
jgi:DNA invertase Pin-like site-specific DNA recombinase